MNLVRSRGVALAFGVNQGYSEFRNEYNIEKKRSQVKFKMDSQFDYYIIESVYQFVFNDETDNESFPYIDAWCPKLKNTNSINQKAVMLLDKQIIIEGAKMKKTIQVELENDHASICRKRTLNIRR